MGNTFLLSDFSCAFIVQTSHKQIFLLLFGKTFQHGLPAPEYNDNAFMLNATIRNGEVNSSDGKVNFDNLNKNELLVYKVIAANPDTTRANLVESLDISICMIDRAIRSLKDKGVIEHIGSDKTRHWRVII